MCESHSSVDEIASIDELDNEFRKTCKSVLNEQQKFADENLFLRFLELDPTEGPDAIPAATQRKATGNRFGRTPFTHTKKLVKIGRSGFGFSVVWTHPPRIERVERGLPAEKAGILPGDYVIFVDKNNVVMMPEVDVLNLIRNCGSQLTLEIFRRNSSRNGSVPSVKRLNSTTGTGSSVGLTLSANLVQRRPSTVCSTNTTSIDYSRRKLQLPQVTSCSQKQSSNPDENRRKAMYQLISKEQQYAAEMQFAVTRYVSALAERKDLLTASEHRTLFQNSEELLRITEDILESLVQEDGEPHSKHLINVYHLKLPDIMLAYKRYCTGLKRADCILANKTKSSNSEFVRFLQVPVIPRKRPDITKFIHKPLEHFREILKLLTTIQSATKSTHEDYPVINLIVHNLQATYTEITSKAGLMEPTGQGRPLLTVQDLENRLVFTKCKPFVLNKPGREWIFGGDLSRVEGRNIRPYWALLFSDIMLFAKVSRDRVLFVIEEPLYLNQISDIFFNIKKKDTEFRITVTPEGRNASSPTVRCGPDLTRTPKKNSVKRTIVLRAPSPEMKAVWQNLLQRQILQVSASMDGSSFSSPLESPDVPITSSVATLQSAESLSFRRQPPHNVDQKESTEMRHQPDAFIENKCKLLSKQNFNSKYNATHLERWIKCQLTEGGTDSPEMEPITEWTEDMLRKRSEELQLIDYKGNVTEARRNENRCQEPMVNDHDVSPSKSTTESQVTVRSTQQTSEPLKVCRQCHKNCLSSPNGNLNQIKNSNNTQHHNCEVSDENDNKKRLSDWRPSLLDLCKTNLLPNFFKTDPFALSVPEIENTSISNCQPNMFEINCTNSTQEDCKNQNDVGNSPNPKEIDISPDDSPETEEHPYHSLSSSVLTLRRFGTVSSLERVGSEEREEKCDTHSSESDEYKDEECLEGIDNKAFNNSSFRSWTMKAGSFVADQFSFFEKFGEDYKGGTFFERYLKTSNISSNGEDLQEEETSGATSGEEIWGTPTSGGEDSMNSPNCDDRLSPSNGSYSPDDHETEIMMDELLMTPAITGAAVRGLLPRRTLEPLIEEDCSESCSSSSGASHTEVSHSPEQGNGSGDVADTRSPAVESPKQKDCLETSTSRSNECSSSEIKVVTKIHRSESYRHIIEAAEEENNHMDVFRQFKPTTKFVNIERIPKSKCIRIFEFFNMLRNERRIYETFPEDKRMVNLFADEVSGSNELPAYCSDKQSQQKISKVLSHRIFVYEIKIFEEVHGEGEEFRSHAGVEPQNCWVCNKKF